MARLGPLIAYLTIVLLASSAGAAVVGTGTLASCDEAAFDAALADGGDVSFDCGYATTIYLTSTKRVTLDTRVDGAGLITLSGGHLVRLLLIEPGVTLTLENLVLADGYSGYDHGGALRNFGDLRLRQCTVLGSASFGFGGALSNEGRCTIEDSTIADNLGANGGGGIANFRSLEIRRSTLFRNGTGTPDLLQDWNDPGNGGGIANFGDLLVANSTLSINYALSNNHPFNPLPGFGGGLFNAGRAVVVNSTFSGNATPGRGYCGGLYSRGDLTAMNNLIVGSSTSCCAEAGATIDPTSGHNLVDRPYSTCGEGFTEVAAEALRLGGLRDNGGQTFTVAPIAGSIAIANGDPEVCASALVAGVDQRGAARFGNGDDSCDIGAVEFPYSSDPAPTPTPGATFVSFNAAYLHSSLPVLLTKANSQIFSYCGVDQLTVVADQPVTARWVFTFAAAAGRFLRIGDYVDVSDSPYNETGHPALSITGSEGGCQGLAGTFTIRELGCDIDGTVERFAVDFERHCFGVPGALPGSVRINSNVPVAPAPTAMSTPTATRTPAAATATPTLVPLRLPCYGDCNRDGRLDLADLLSSIDVALGRTSPAECNPLDTNLDGSLTVDELVISTWGWLNGCRPLSPED